MSAYAKIGLYGDSLAMARPDVVNNEERYFKMVLDHFAKQNPNTMLETVQRVKASITSSELAELFYHDNVYYSWPGEICMIHYGIVDCAPRPVATETKEKISKLPGGLKKLAVKYLHNNRRNILLKGKAHYVTSKPSFTANTKTIIESAVQNYKKIFLINISPTNSETEFRSPGLSKSIEEYNDILKKEAETLGKGKINVIDVFGMIKSFKNLDEYVVKEDGHHITPRSHKLIFEKIKEQLG